MPLQEKRFIKLSNIAKSISEISSQASLFVPITLPSTKLPNYVALDPTSRWHVSALFSTALESMTLPSRLKVRNGNRVTMDHLISALNINGNQNIAKLRMSIDQQQPDDDRTPGMAASQSRNTDVRIPSHERSNHGNAARTEVELSTFDVDFFPTEAGEQNGGRRHYEKLHVFGQAENHRSEDETTGISVDEGEGFERARRRAAGLPIVQK